MSAPHESPCTTLINIYISITFNVLDLDCIWTTETLLLLLTLELKDLFSNGDTM